MAHKMLKTIAKMGRATGLTRDELVAKLASFGTPEEVEAVIDEVMAQPQQGFDASVSRAVSILSDELPSLHEGEGVGVDVHDRRTKALLEKAFADPEDLT